MLDKTDSADLLDTAVTDLTLAVGLFLRRMRAEANAGELSWSQVATLGRLEKAGWMTTADLARAELVKPQSMGVTLADLEQAGLVCRRPHPTDGRQVLFGLTKAGIEARRLRGLAKRAWLMRAMGGLTGAEQQSLAKAAALIKRLSDS